MSTTTQEIGQLLRDDHEYLRYLFSCVRFAEDADLSVLFRDVHTALLQHDRAEELVFYPAIRRRVPDGDNIAAAYISECEETQQLIGELERRPANAATFRYCLKELREQILSHAHHEEVDPLVLLEENLNRRELEKLGTQYKNLLGESPGRPMI